MLKPISFIKILASVFIGISLFVSSILFFIDPRGLFNAILVDGINAKKYSFFQREHVIKPYTILGFKPASILIGNSIANSAFDLSHPFFENRRTYSYGIAGAGVYINQISLNQLNQSLPESALYILDFSAFYAANAGNNKDLVAQSGLPARLKFHTNGKKNYSYFLQVMKDYSLTLLSWEITADSIETWRRQQEDGWHLLPNGAWGGGSTQVGKPQYKRFQYVEREVFFRPLANQPATIPFTRLPDQIDTLTYFESILTYLYSKKIETTLVIPPAHARTYEMLFIQDRWRDYVAWKTDLTYINHRVATTHGKRPFPLWDFSGYNQHTTETVPDRVDRQTRMQWFYDGVHIKPALGTLMLDIMSGQPDDHKIGQQININSVASQLANMFADHQRYAASHPADVNDLLNSCQAVMPEPSRCFAPVSQTPP